MERAEFLRLVGAGVGLAALAPCLQGCRKQQDAPLLSVDFTLDLSQSTNQALTTNGGYLVTQRVIVARTLDGNYIAVAASCTHQGVTVQYQASSYRFHCNGHGANFNESGGVINGPATTALQQMYTSLDGQMLRVWS
ncbi:MAG: Rieske 2Fe-2S domain-containing protein [Flavobacteriales bacterium]|nr:Rieske 2Fe-2S domain-containing protein [Flavobacteriales bacterium]MCB9193953.1 Rieske 2Fe-2S domain-containing protein [Flavobacteriales bacterium]